MLTHFPLRPVPLPSDPAAGFSGGLAAFLLLAILALALAAAGGTRGSVERAPYIAAVEQVSSCKASLDPRLSRAPAPLRPDCRART